MNTPNSHHRSGATTRAVTLTLLGLAAIIALCAATPISNLTLQGNANAGGNSITNAATLSATNFAGGASGLTNFPNASTMGLTNTFDTNGAAAAVLASSLQKSDNLSDLSNTATARTNLGLGTLATSNTITTSNLTGLGSGVPAALAATTSGTGSIPLTSNATLNSPVLNTPISLLPQASTYATTYLVSMRLEADTTGPKTFTSPDTSTFYPLYKGTAGADIFTAPGPFADPRIIKVGSLFYLFYGATTGGASNSIGLAVSSDLSNWTNVTTPNWSSLFSGSQNSIANGCLYFDGTNYWLFFSTFYSTVTPPFSANPYVVEVYPSGTNTTFGIPTAITFNNTRAYATITACVKSGSTLYGLVQSAGATTGTNQYVETWSSPTLTGTNYTLTTTNNADGFGSSVETGDLVQLPNGSWKAYFCDFGGGNLYSSTNANLATNAWSARTTLSPFPSLYPTQAIDWIDVVPFTDLQTDQSLNALQRGTGIVSNYQTIALNIPGSATTIALQNLEAGLSSGNFVSYWFGKAFGTGETGNIFYQYSPSTAGQDVGIGIYAVGPTMGLWGDGNGYIGNYSSDPNGSAPAGSFTIGKNLYTNGPVNIAATQTTSNGSVAGTVVSSMPFAGSSYKKVMFILNGFNGTATYTSPTSFSSTNVAIGPTLSGIVTMVGTNIFSISTSTNTTAAGGVEGD